MAENTVFDMKAKRDLQKKTKNLFTIAAGMPKTCGRRDCK